MQSLSASSPRHETNHVLFFCLVLLHMLACFVRAMRKGDSPVAIGIKKLVVTLCMKGCVCVCAMQMTAMTAICTLLVLVPQLAQASRVAQMALSASTQSFRTMKPSGDLISGASCQADLEHPAKLRQNPTLVDPDRETSSLLSVQARSPEMHLTL